MKGVKGLIFVFLIALLAFIPYSMVRYNLVATHLAPLRPFVFGVREAPTTGKGVAVNGAVKNLPVLAYDTSHGSVFSANAYPSVWEDRKGKGDTKEYVNRAYGLSLSFPADWVERPLVDSRQVLRVGPPGQGDYPILAITVLPLCLYSLEQSSKMLVCLLGDDVGTLYEKNSRLKDGASAIEAQFEWMKEGKQVTTMMLATLRGHTLIMAHLSHTSGPTEEEMKKILYSLTMKPGVG